MVDAWKEIKRVLDSLIKFYELKTGQMPSENIFLQRLNISKSLNEILMKTPPLYEWDDKYLETEINFT